MNWGMLPFLYHMKNAFSKAGSDLEIARFSVIFEQNERGGYLKMEMSGILNEGFRPQNPKIRNARKKRQHSP